MSSINDLIEQFTSSNQNNLTASVNDLERDGNTSDVLFRFEQAANALSVSGGTTLTNISPYTAIQDLGNGKLSLAAIIWLAIGAVLIWWLTKRQ